MRKTFYCLAASLLLGLDIFQIRANDAIFSENFDTQGDFDKWTIINTEEGSVTWSYRTSTGKPMKSKCAQILKHSPNAANDWLISPAFRLKTGTVYELSFRCTPGTFNKKEHIKAYLGNSQTVDGMTMLLLDLPDMLRDDEADITRKAEVTVKQDGIYYLGFLGCSEANQGRIDLDEITVSEKTATVAPGPVTDLSITSGSKGALSATLKFTAPKITAAGDELASISNIKIYRESALVATINNPAPGADQIYIDENAVQGFNNYNVVCETNGIKSIDCTQSVFVGIDIPVAVVNPRAVSKNDGKIQLAWTAPGASVNGGYFDTETLKYVITNLTSEESVTVQGNSYEYTFPMNVQAVYEFSIAPMSEAGTGEASKFNRVIMGLPIDSEYHESFAGATVHSTWYQDSDENDFVWIVDNPEKEEYYDPDVKDYIIYAQDKDGGDLIAKTKYAFGNQTSRYCSPIFNFSKFKNPVLKFYQVNGPSSCLKVQMRTVGGNWIDLAEPIWKKGAGGLQWNLCTIPLANIKESGDVQLSFLANGGERQIHIDNISIEESGYTHDIAVRNLTASPRRANIGEVTTFTADIRNFGGQKEDEYAVVFYRDGKAVGKITGEELEATASSTLDFKYISTLDDAMQTVKSEWTAAVELATDQCTDNDTSAPVVWSVRPSDVPDASGLTAVNTENGVCLSWNKGIDRSAAEKGEMKFVTDDFEAYAPFAIDNVGDWLFIDKDGSRTWDSKYPNRPYVGEPLSFMIFNTYEGKVQTEDNQDNIFFAHSGKQYVMGFSNAEYGTPNDDWLITPRLDGRAHKIGFYARNPMGLSGDDIIAISYSTTDRDPDSFITLNGGENINISDNWKHIETEVPEGARYFAVNLKLSRMFFMLDDVTYAVHDGSLDELKLLGYNVYRNDMKINQDLIEDNNYIDVTAPAGANNYKVTAVYKQGESRYSNIASVITSGIGKVDGDSQAVVYAIDNSVHINSNRGCTAEIYSIDGRKITAVNVDGETAIELNSGVFIVVVDGKTTKVVI